MLEAFKEQLWLWWASTNFSIYPWNFNKITYMLVNMFFLLQNNKRTLKIWKPQSSFLSELNHFFSFIGILPPSFLVHKFILLFDIVLICQCSFRVAYIIIIFLILVNISVSIADLLLENFPSSWVHALEILCWVSQILFFWKYFYFTFINYWMEGFSCLFVCFWWNCRSVLLIFFSAHWRNYSTVASTVVEKSAMSLPASPLKIIYSAVAALKIVSLS